MAFQLARTTKRLDLVAAQVARALHLAGRPRLEGASVLELGAGWVLSHSLVFHLLGARRVVASDVERHAQPGALRAAIAECEPSLVMEQLNPFADPAGVRERVDRLRRLGDLTAPALARLGIEYRAPQDLAAAPHGGDVVDVIYSNSVLEHVPVDRCSGLVSALLARLAPDGQMLHAIHLEDHASIERSPFAFLAEDAGAFGEEEQGRRGNRLRASAWLTLLKAGGTAEVTVLFAASRAASLLPARIDPRVAFEDELDLRTSHLLLRVRRPAA